MKKLVLILCVSFLAMSCSSDDTTQEENTTLVGTWQLVEIYLSDGEGSGGWNSIDDGYTYTFKSDSTFTSNRFSECTTGKYSVSATQLVLEYDCEDFTTEIESPEGTFIENFKMEDRFIFLTPAYLQCIEGCSYKFLKIKE